LKTKDESKGGYQAVRRGDKNTITESKNLGKVRGTQILTQDRLVTLLDKPGSGIHDQNKIIERILQRGIRT